jgi:hypothetical protein
MSISPMGKNNLIRSLSIAPSAASDHHVETGQNRYQANPRVVIQMSHLRRSPPEIHRAAVFVNPLL